MDGCFPFVLFAAEPGPAVTRSTWLIAGCFWSCNPLSHLRSSLTSEARSPQLASVFFFMGAGHRSTLIPGDRRPTALTHRSSEVLGSTWNSDVDGTWGHHLFGSSRKWSSEGFRGHAIHGTGAFSVVGGPINDERR